jgi:hypothetical protein
MGSQGSIVSANDVVGTETGSANYQCTNTGWVGPSSATCVAAPPTGGCWAQVGNNLDLSTINPGGYPTSSLVCNNPGHIVAEVRGGASCSTLFETCDYLWKFGEQTFECRNDLPCANTSCPAGTSATGLGEMATPSCKCLNSGETWNVSTLTCNGTVTTTTVPSCQADGALVSGLGISCTSVGNNYGAAPGICCSGSMWGYCSSAAGLATTYCGSGPVTTTTTLPPPNCTNPCSLNSPVKPIPYDGTTLGFCSGSDKIYSSNSSLCNISYPTVGYKGTCSANCNFTCPAGTNVSGTGAAATPTQCRCNNASETWNGSACVGAPPATLPPSCAANGAVVFTAGGSDPTPCYPPGGPGVQANSACCSGYDVARSPGATVVGEDSCTRVCTSAPPPPSASNSTCFCAWGSGGASGGSCSCKCTATGAIVSGPPTGTPQLNPQACGFPPTGFPQPCGGSTGLACYVGGSGGGGCTLFNASVPTCP